MNQINQITRLVRNGVKISAILKEAYGNQKISIPFNDGDFDVPLANLDLSVRSYNALRRHGLVTLDDVIKEFDKHGWSVIKNFGRTSAMEVFEKIIDFAWDNMSDAEKTDFLISVVEE